MKKFVFFLIIFLSLSGYALATTETLRPDEAGDETNIPDQTPSSGLHWDKVDEATPDESTTNVWEGAGAEKRDLYNLPASSGQGDITNLTVYYRVVTGIQVGGSTRASMKTGGTAYNGTAATAPLSWTTRSHAWATNPKTGVAWTWDDIDALQIGVALTGWWSTLYAQWVAVLCTQVYAVITYTPWVDIGIRVRKSGETIKIGVRTLIATDKLRIRKGDTTYGIPLLAASDGRASSVRIYDGSAIKSPPEID